MSVRKEVLKNNERVNLLGVWNYGFFALSFIGAMNVGSVSVNFDESLVTNEPDPQAPYFSDFHYSQLGQSASAETKDAQEEAVTRDYDNGSDETAEYEARMANRRAIQNRGDPGAPQIKKRKNRKPDLMYKAPTGHQYSCNARGVKLTKGQEVGFFRMGSTVAIIFEGPSDLKMHCKVGEKVKLGQRLYD